MKKWLVIVSTLILLSVAGGCIFFKMAMPTPQASPEEIQALARAGVHVDGDPPFDISYLSAGNPDDPNIIFVHGTPGAAREWADFLIRDIPERFRIAYDRPGFGDTRPLIPVSSLKRQAQAIEPFLVEKKGRWPILVGHSLGGPIVCEAAALYTDRIAGLVVLAGSVDPDLEKIHWWQKVANWAFVPYLLPKILVNANREVFPLKEELEKLQPLLARIICPVVIVHGDKDKLVPVENADYLTRNLTGSPVVDLNIIPGQNHLLPWNNQRAVNQAIDRLMTILGEKITS